jgi:hypothetical protein
MTDLLHNSEKNGAFFIRKIFFMAIAGYFDYVPISVSIFCNNSVRNPYC